MGRRLQVQPESPGVAKPRAALTEEQREAIRERFRPKINNMEICSKVIDLRQLGKNTADIAREVKISQGTVLKILARYGDPFAESLGIIKAKLPQITAMVMDEVLANKDRRTGALILERTGLLDTIRPKVEPQEDGGRIVIEWSGAPPPWAPKSVLDAYAARGLAHTTQPALPNDSPTNGHPPTCAKVGTDAASCPTDVVDVVVEDISPASSNSDTPPANVSSSS